MDPRQSQSSQYLRPPPAHGHPHHHHQQQQPQQRAPAPSTPRAPVTVHPTATIADAVVFQGTHPIAIGAETIIHPRARIYSFEGPVIIGERCIISEKSTIGTASPTPTPTPNGTPTGSETGAGTGKEEGIPTRISHSVTIAPLASILPGAHLHSSVTIDSLAIIHPRANIGSHAKVCAGCHVPRKASVKDWTVVWGSGAGFGQRRKRATKAATAGVGGMMQQQQQQQQGQLPLEGRVIEDARLVVLQKEREALVKLIGSSGAAAPRRR